MYEEDLNTEKKKGIVNQGDKTPIGNTVMGSYFNSEQQAVKKLLEKSEPTKDEQRRIENYNRIMEVKKQIKQEQKSTYIKSKEEFDEVSTFSQTVSFIKDKENQNGRKTS